MNTITTELWGNDIALDPSGQALVAANGEFILTDGVDTGLQDIRLRLFTRLGTLFYDVEFGSLIHDWILEESTPENRSAFTAEVTMRVECDPRVVVGSVRTDIMQWDERSLYAVVQWHFIGEDQPQNLVLQADKAIGSLLISDTKPTDAGKIVMNATLMAGGAL